MIQLMILAFAFIIASTTASAHGTSQHVLGTVTVIDENHMEIKTTKGGTVSIQLDKQTRFKSKRKPRSTEPPVVGDRVVVEATRDEKTGLIATEVHYASASRVPQPAPELAPASSTDEQTPKPPL